MGVGWWGNFIPVIRARSINWAQLRVPHQSLHLTLTPTDNQPITRIWQPPSSSSLPLQIRCSRGSLLDGISQKVLVTLLSGDLGAKLHDRQSRSRPRILCALSPLQRQHPLPSMRCTICSWSQTFPRSHLQPLQAPIHRSTQRVLGYLRRTQRV
jgi:hypothetical protein